MPKVKVDGIELDVPAGATVLQACELAGKEIPRFCYHERLSIAGNCRMCLVEVKPGPPKPQASCALPAAEGQEIRTDNLAEIKMLLAQFGAGFAQSFAESGLQSVITPSGTVLTSQNNGFQQAGAQGVQNAANLYAQQIADTVKREGIFVRVPAGTDFYLYVTQTIDAGQARVGATMAAHGADTAPSKIIP